MANRVLILTDRNYHRERDSIFPIAAHLSENPLIEKVWVADRSDAANDAFYKNLDPAFDRWRARSVSPAFTMANALDDGMHPQSCVTADDFDAVWIRLEYPVSIAFLEYLRRLLPEKFMLNDPIGLTHTISKANLVDFKPVMGDLMPNVALCKTAVDVDTFVKTCPQGIVLKQVFSNGGHGVARYRPGRDTDLQTPADVSAYLQENGACLAMEYLSPPGPQSDNRVLVMKGVLLGVVSRIPKDGSWICNLSSGGSARPGEATAQELDIVRRIDPEMRKHGIFFYGVDTLLNDKGLRVLSEINTLNVGALAVSERLTGRPLTKFLADNLAACIAARSLDIPIVGQEKIAA